MKRVKIDEYLVINIRTGKERFLKALPRTLGAYDVAVRIKATVIIPDMLPILDLGEVTIPELEALAEASMK